MVQLNMEAAHYGVTLFTSEVVPKTDDLLVVIDSDDLFQSRFTDCRHHSHPLHLQNI